MIYRDPLYGKWELPPVIQELVQSQAMDRYRKITMSLLPNSMEPLGTIPSRFHHGLGVCFLALKVDPTGLPWQKVNFNPLTLPVAAFLHDIGNPPFSHLSEPFLKEVRGKDAEAFAAEMIADTDIPEILEKYDIPIEAVLDFIAGRLKPYSDILNGSLDVDNLDTFRYDYFAKLGGIDYDPVKIAGSFRFENNCWVLDKSCRSNVAAWKMHRAMVYRKAYSSQHLSAVSMVHRALEFAFLEGELNPNFFFLSDEGAVDYLRIKCNQKTVKLMEMASRWQWYDLAYDFETTEPGEWLLAASAKWQSRMDLADLVNLNLGVPKESVCCYIDRGRDTRKVEIPFSEGGKLEFDNEKETPIYRIKIFTDPAIGDHKEGIKKIVGWLIN
jgi:HD superfamily phosphohydrolase